MTAPAKPIDYKAEYEKLTAYYAEQVAALKAEHELTISGMKTEHEKALDAAFQEGKEEGEANLTWQSDLEDYTRALDNDPHHARALLNRFLQEAGSTLTV